MRAPKVKGLRPVLGLLEGSMRLSPLEPPRAVGLAMEHAARSVRSDLKGPRAIYSTTNRNYQTAFTFDPRAKLVDRSKTSAPNMQ